MTKLNTTLLKDLPIKQTSITDDDYVIVSSGGTKKLKIKDITKDVEKKAADLEVKTKELGSQLDTITNDIENNYAKKNEVGQPSQEQVDNWFNNNPDATTTVQDYSISNSKLKEQVVYPNNMFGVKNGSNNLWQPVKYMQDVAITGSTTMNLSSYSNAITVIHKIEPNTQYQILKSSSDRFRVIGFKDMPSLGDSTTEKYVYNDVSTSFTFNTGDVNYIAIHLTSTNVLPSQINIFKGTGFTEFEDITYVLPLAKESQNINIFPKNSILPEYLIGVTSSKNNIWEPLKTMYDTAITGTTTLKLSTYTGGIVVVHEVKPNTTYQIIKTESDRFRVIGYENEPIIGDSTTEKYVYNDVSTSFTFNTGDVNYIAIHLTSSNTLPDKINMFIGDGYTDFEEEGEIKYKIPFANKSIPISAIDGNISSDVEKKYYLCNLPSEEYKTNTEYEEPLRTTAQAIYDRFDSMMNDNPGYITRTLLGYDDGDLPIYVYNFYPIPCRDNYLNNKMPRILHINGLHGHELHNVFEGLRFFEDLVTNWKNNPLLEVIRKQVKISYIPIASPWCYENNSRININGVDPNRNFPPRWTYSGEGTNYYSGSTPLCEKNTKIIDDYLKENADDLDFAFDHHNFNSISTDGYATWYGYKNPTIGKIMFGLAAFSDSKIRREYKYIDDSYPESEHLSKARYYLSQGTLAEQMEDYGVPSIIFETVAWFGVSSFGKESNIDCKKYIVEILGNLYLTILKNINDL